LSANQNGPKPLPGFGRILGVIYFLLENDFRLCLCLYCTFHNVRTAFEKVGILNMEFSVGILNCEGRNEAIFTLQTASSVLIRQEKGDRELQMVPTIRSPKIFPI
jgi:hypothetical protein